MVFTLLGHAFSIVFRNFTQALLASFFPMLFVVGAGYLAFLLLLSSSSESGLYIWMFVILCLGFVAFCWVAVTWHRFVLLEEQPTLIPQFKDRPILPYLGKLILAVLLTAAVSLVCLLALMFAGFLLGTFGSIVTGIAAVLFLYAFWFRIAIVLPGTAVDKPMHFREGWEQTEGWTGTLIGLAIVFGIFQNVLELIVDATLAGSPIIHLIVTLVYVWLIFMLSIAILTTLYGHIIEGRVV